MGRAPGSNKIKGELLMKHERMAKKPYTREDLEVLLDRMPFWHG